MIISKSKARSKLRLKLGKTYYTYRRYVKWYLGKDDFALTKNNNSFSYKVIAHKTPLYRKLKNVDMWLQHNKVKNLQIAVQCVNNIILKPKQTFSFWRLVGKPSMKKGYVKGMVIDNGKVSIGIGGGLCQLTNLIYWLTLHTPLIITERYRHAFDVFPDETGNSLLEVVQHVYIITVIYRYIMIPKCHSS